MAILCATVSSYLVTSATASKKPALISSPSSSSPSSVSVLISSPSKPTRRRNTLRPKLLKTLPKPYSTPLLPQQLTLYPTIPFDSDEPETISDQDSRDSRSIAAGEAPSGAQQAMTASVSVAPTVDSAILDAGGESLPTGSVLKFGLWLVGMFVFQTVVCAVWVLGSSKLDQRNGNFKDDDESRASLDGKEKERAPPIGMSGMPFFGNNELKPQTGAVWVDEYQLEAKVNEIRAMAREARQSERKELDAKGMVDEEDNDGEVDFLLDTSQKRLDSIRDKSLVSMISYLSRPGKVEDRKKVNSAHVKEATGALLFGKRNKFRNPPIESRDKPMEFGGLGKSSDSNVKNKNSGKSNPMALEKENGGKSVSKDPKSLQIDGIKLQNDKGSTEMGVVQETSDERPSIKGEEESKVPNLEKTHIAKSSRKGKLDNTKVSNKSVKLSKNSNLQSNGARSKSEISKVTDNQSRVTTDVWWMNLQYVLAINIHRGSNPDGPEGLFTLKASSAEEQSEPSYVVAFEDHNDAANFCYILEAVFEELDNFVADVIFIPIKDLAEMKVIVVKKQQIRMYAGQPLADVEMALRSLMVPDQAAESPNPNET